MKINLHLRISCESWKFNTSIGVFLFGTVQKAFTEFFYCENIFWRKSTFNVVSWEPVFSNILTFPEKYCNSFGVYTVGRLKDIMIVFLWAWRNGTDCECGGDEGLKCVKFAWELREIVYLAQKWKVVSVLLGWVRACLKFLKTQIAKMRAIVPISRDSS